MQRPTLLLAALFVVVLSVAAGCASTPPPVETITVEGTATMRGAEPFAAYVLETDGDNLYVLVFPDDLREGFRARMPVRVSGELYRGLWSGVHYAHIRVTAWEPLSP